MSTPHDPAVEAARRVWARDHIGPVLAPAEAMEDAAREALAPIRELHVPVRACSNPEHEWAECGGCEICCDHCGDLWPCDTAKLSYPQEEL